MRDKEITVHSSAGFGAPPDRNVVEQDVRQFRSHRNRAGVGLGLGSFPARVLRVWRASMDRDRQFPEIDVGDLQAGEFTPAHARFVKAGDHGKIAVAHRLALERVLRRRRIDEGEKPLALFRCQALSRLGCSMGSDLGPGVQESDGIAKAVLGTGGAVVACKPFEVCRDKADTVGPCLGRKHCIRVARKPSKRLFSRPDERQDVVALRSFSRVRNLCRLERMRETLDFSEVEAGAGGHSRLERESVRQCPFPGNGDRAHVRFDRAFGAARVPEHGDRIPNRFEYGSAPALDQRGERFAAGKGDDSDGFGHESLQNRLGPLYPIMRGNGCQGKNSEKSKVCRELTLRTLLFRQWAA